MGGFSVCFLSDDELEAMLMDDIIDYMRSSSDRLYFTFDDIVDAIKKEHSSYSPAMITNALERLCSNGIVHPFSSDLYCMGRSGFMISEYSTFLRACDISRYDELEALVLDNISSSFYIFQLLERIDDKRGSFTDYEVIACLDNLVEKGVLVKNHACYKKV